jgi:hypothetical protein
VRPPVTAALILTLVMASSNSLAGENPLRPYVVSLLVEGETYSDASVELPEIYLGAWGRGPGSDSYVCVGQNEINKITIRAEPRGEWWEGFVFSVDGRLYAYVLAGHINLATGTVIRFSSAPSNPRMEYLDLDSLLELLKARPLSFRENPFKDRAVVVVDYPVLREVLADRSLRFGGKASGPALAKLPNEVDCPAFGFEQPSNSSPIDISQRSEPDRQRNFKLRFPHHRYSTF